MLELPISRSFRDVVSITLLRGGCPGTARGLTDLTFLEKDFDWRDQWSPIL